MQVREKAVRVTSSLHFLRSFGTKNKLRWGEGEGTESLDEKTQLVSNSEIFTVKDIITHRLVICLFSFKKPAKCNINERLCPQQIRTKGNKSSERTFGLKIRSVDTYKTTLSRNVLSTTVTKRWFLTNMGDRNCSCFHIMMPSRGVSRRVCLVTLYTCI